eukprot:3214405-Amphidinium_carterae.1
MSEVGLVLACALICVKLLRDPAIAWPCASKRPESSASRAPLQFAYPILGSKPLVSCWLPFQSAHSAPHFPRRLLVVSAKPPAQHG